MSEYQTTNEWRVGNDLNGEQADQLSRSSDSAARKSGLSLEKWEIAVLVISFCLVAFVAMPNYFNSLDALRGDECSDKLTLLATTLHELAERNGTGPGERICEQFDLNEALEKAQGGGMIATAGNLPMYYKVGAEPDCPDTAGNHHYSLIMGSDGRIVPPTCTLGEGKSGNYYRERGLHIARMNEVYPVSEATVTDVQDMQNAAADVQEVTDTQDSSPPDTLPGTIPESSQSEPLSE